MIFGLWSRGPAMIYIFFALLPVETFAVVPPAMLGGVTFTPDWVTAGLLFLKLLFIQPSPAQALAPLFDPRRIGLLSACALYGLISAYFFPRIFEGRVIVFPMHLFGGFATDTLKPTTSNITQCFYFALTTLTVLTFYWSARDKALRPHIMNGILLGGLVTVLTGLADIFVPASVLAPMRTATYALLTDSEVLGAKRVVGLMPEASAYAGVCMSFAAPIFLLRPTFRSKIMRSLIAPTVFLALLVMIVLSTSSTGYLGLAVLFATLTIYGCVQFMHGNPTGKYTLGFVCLASLAGLAILTMMPSLLDRPAALINATIFQKTTSESYIGRGMWNTVSLQAFRDTFGLGAGLGSVRASSWPVALLGNIGIIGTMLMAGFVLSIVNRRQIDSKNFDRNIASAAKLALIPLLGMASLSGTSVGFGLMPAVLIGVAGAAIWQPAAPSIRRRKLGEYR
jgi:hypothetical protein